MSDRVVCGAIQILISDIWMSSSQLNLGLHPLTLPVTLQKLLSYQEWGELGCDRECGGGFSRGMAAFLCTGWIYLAKYLIPGV